MSKKFAFFAALLVAAFLQVEFANAAITTSLDLGSTGAQVTELQTYLASRPNLYPEGLVTGYFGVLTEAAVQRFQQSEGIVSSGTPASTGYGRVGPTTRARLNLLMGTGVGWDTVPVLSVPTVTQSNTSATVSFTTNEPTTGQVYFDILPVRSDEATGPRQLPYISGSLAAGAAVTTSHIIPITALAPNTTYYFVVRVIDAVGNVSMTLQKTFRTNN